MNITHKYFNIFFYWLLHLPCPVIRFNVAEKCPALMWGDGTQQSWEIYSNRLTDTLPVLVSPRWLFLFLAIMLLERRAPAKWKMSHNTEEIQGTQNTDTTQKLRDLSFGSRNKKRIVRIVFYYIDKAVWDTSMLLSSKLYVFLLNIQKYKEIFMSRLPLW